MVSVVTGRAGSNHLLEQLRPTLTLMLITERIFIVLPLSTAGPVAP